MDPFKLISQMDGMAAQVSDDPVAQQQLRDFWQHLDSLADKDPEEYARFMQKQLSEGRKEFEETAGKTKIEGFYSYAVKTYTQGKKIVVVVNVCHSPK